MKKAILAKKATRVKSVILVPLVLLVAKAILEIPDLMVFEAHLEFKVKSVLLVIKEFKAK